MSFTQGLNVTDYALGTVSLSKQIYCCHMTQRLLKNGPYVARVKASIKIGTVLPQSEPRRGSRGGEMGEFSPPFFIFLSLKY